MFAQVCAVARQFPSFIVTLKKQSVETNIQVRDAKRTEIVVVFDGSATPEDVELLARLEYVCEDIQLCQHLVDMPTNYLYVDTYVAECEKVHARLLQTELVTARGECRIEVIRGRDLEVMHCVYVCCMLCADVCKCAWWNRLADSAVSGEWARPATTCPH